MGQRALFKCALWIAKLRGRISNLNLIVQVMKVALALGKSLRGAIIRAGRGRVEVMRAAYARPGGVLSWVSQMNRWLNDEGYVWYLGVIEVNR